MIPLYFTKPLKDVFCFHCFDWDVASEIANRVFMSQHRTLMHEQAVREFERRCKTCQPSRLHCTGYPADGSLTPAEMNHTWNAVQLFQLLSIDVCCCDLSSLLCKCLQLERLVTSKQFDNVRTCCGTQAAEKYWQCYKQICLNAKINHSCFDKSALDSQNTKA